MLRHLVGRAAPVLVAALLTAATARPADAQSELTGSWNQIATEDVSNDSVPVDYMGLPLTEEARAKALTYSEADRKSTRLNSSHRL